MAPNPNPSSQFPYKTALALATAVAALAALHFFYDSGKGLNPGIFAEAAKLNLIRHPAPPTVAVAPPNPLTQTTPQPGALNGIQQPGSPAKRPPISEFLMDDSGALDPFYAELAALTRPSNGVPPQVVTILHYGDSPTTADLITGDVRAALQQRFGDAGHGYLLTAKPWAWYQHRDIDINDHGWQISTAVGKGREEVYGLGGASFEGSASAGSHITLHDKTPDQAYVEIDYLAQPNGGSLTVAADGAPVKTFSTASETAHPAWLAIAIPPATNTLDLTPAGPVRLFGETFHSISRGVLYDSLGLNGASTSALSNGFNNAAWTAELQHTHPALVIINYGTNESGFGSYVDKQYEPTLRTAITRIRAALPNEPILIMSPMDRGRRSGVDQIETFDTIPRIVAIQRRVAAEQNCAFFDTFNAMGGDGTMSRWYTGHPRLVAGDLIHPTPQGASIVANLFVKDLLAGYERYVKAHPASTSSLNGTSEQNGMSDQDGISDTAGTPSQATPAAPPA
jgi:lysophospholipase L1-like esterase